MFVAYGDGCTRILRRMCVLAAWAACLCNPSAVAQYAGSGAYPSARPGQFGAPRAPGPQTGAVGLQGPANPGSPQGAESFRGPQDPANSDQPRGMVAGVRVEGNETVSDRQVLSEVKTRQDRMFDAETLQADAHRLLRKFADVEIFTQPAPGGVLVTFRVVEHPTIREILFIGNRGISDKALLRQAGLTKGDPLDVYNVDEARGRVEQFYHTKGFPKALVQVTEGNRANDRRVVFDISEGNLERLSQVRFIGNDPSLATDARLKTLIKSKPGVFRYIIGAKIDTNKIESDEERLTAYYRRLGYFRAMVSSELDYDASGRWARLDFVINEGPRYVVRNVSVNGAERFAAEKLLEQLKLKSGDYFDQVKMKRDENTLLDIYGGNGYIFANIAAQPRFLEEPGYLDVVYKVEEGGTFRVGKINVHIAGEFPHTRHSVILNRLSLRPGEVIDIRKVRESERRLRASQLFESNPQTGDPPKIVVQPPELQEGAGSLAGRGGSRGFRGQSPDDDTRRFKRPANVDVHVTPRRGLW